MRKRLGVGRWLAGLAFFVVCSSVAVWAVGRFSPPNAEQRAALAALAIPKPAATEADAFPALWTLPYAVPESAMAAVYAEDARNIAAIPEPWLSGSDDTTAAGAAGYRSVAAERYPDQTPTEADTQRFCTTKDDCLNKVAADLDGFAALLERNAAFLDRVEALARYERTSLGFGQRIDAPMPQLRSLGWLRTRYAWAFANGDRAAAFDGVCRNIATLRRIGAGSDTLIVRLVATSLASDGYTHLFAEMLAQTPNDAALPPACDAAFATPNAQERSLCRAIRGEFAFVTAGLRAGEAIEGARRVWWKRWANAAVYDPERTVAEVAPSFAKYCGEEIDRAIAADDPAIAAEPPRDWFRFDCAGNFGGCILAQIAAPDYSVYAKRVQDANARIGLMAGLLRLRGDTAETSLSARARAFAARSKTPQRGVVLSEDGRSLRVALYAPASGNAMVWEVPLPGSRVSTPTP